MLYRHVTYACYIDMLNIGPLFVYRRSVPRIRVKPTSTWLTITWWGTTLTMRTLLPRSVQSSPRSESRVYLITPPHWEHLIDYNFSHYILFILQSLNTFISNYLDILKQHLPVHIFSLDTVVFCNSIIYRVTIFTLDFCLSNWPKSRLGSLLT